MGNAAVSVIVPVYNAEKTLPACLESILGQSFEDMEVLAVDDGSTDGSLRVLRDFAARDPRVRVFSQRNSGVAAARNLAIDNASGDYLQFVDSDDRLPADATERMVEAIRSRECDLVIAPYTEVIGLIRQKRGFLDRDMLLSQRQFLGRMAEHPNSFFYAVMWNKLYRADIVRAHDDIICAEDMDWSEDLYFNLSYIRYAEKFYALSTPIYNYFNTPGSAVHTALNPVNIVATRATLFAYYKELYEHLGLYEEYKPQIYKYLVAVAEA